MVRSIGIWRNMLPAAVAEGSHAQVLHALVDARHDILALHAALTPADVAALTPADDPQWDATDRALNAWWRGEDYGSTRIVRAVAAILDGEPVRGICSEPFQSVRVRIAELVAKTALTPVGDAGVREGLELAAQRVEQGMPVDPYPYATIEDWAAAAMSRSGDAEGV